MRQRQKQAITDQIRATAIKSVVLGICVFIGIYLCGLVIQMLLTCNY